ncbi:hypothetical protein [Actinomadura hibisca]|uniref:hypothetical protein n=1 Tax=Actinomadura hibisca TaxID=68565 RepID=UPI00082E1395|nr:hypothetical protein [Actinomadura hibisca]
MKRALTVAGLATTLAAGTLAVTGTAADAATHGTFGPTGYAGVKIGMSAKQAAKTHKLVRKFKGGICSGYDLKGHPTGKNAVGVYVSKKYGVALITAPKGAATPRGIHTGSTFKQLKRAYPGVKRDIHGYYNVKVNSKVLYQFTVSKSKVSEMSLNAKKQDCYN